MADAFIHLTACEQLAQDSRLFPEVGAVMSRNLSAAKLGAIFVDLPHYQGIYGSMLRHWLRLPHRLGRWSDVFHMHRPTALGIAFGELTQTDLELTGEPWALAFVAGYFSHLAFDRVIHALINRLVRENLQPTDDATTLHFKCEYIQALLFHRELYGADVVGTRVVRKMTATQLVNEHDHDAEVLRFIVRGCLKGLGMAPAETEVVKWARGFAAYLGILTTPIAKLYNVRDNDEGRRLTHTFYRNDFFNYVTFYNRAMALAVDYVNAVFLYLSDMDFSDEARADLLLRVPEIDIANPPEDEIFAPPAENHHPVILPFERPKL